MMTNLSTNGGADFDPTQYEYKGGHPIVWLAYKVFGPIMAFFYKHGLSFLWPVLIIISLAIFYYLYPYIFHKERTSSQKGRDVLGLLILIPAWIFILVFSIIQQIQMNQANQ
jgi:membrane associated rhomboid family serine protease